jgi:hypothetical protein
VYGIGLKTLIADVGAAHGPSVAAKVGPLLLEGLQDKRQVRTRGCCAAAMRVPFA